MLHAFALVGVFLRHWEASRHSLSNPWGQVATLALGSRIRHRVTTIFMTIRSSRHARRLPNRLASVRPMLSVGKALFEHLQPTKAFLSPHLAFSFSHVTKQVSDKDMTMTAIQMGHDPSSLPKLGERINPADSSLTALTGIRGLRARKKDARPPLTSRTHHDTDQGMPARLVVWCGAPRVTQLVHR
jgi:hypothetical protein